MVAKAPSKVEEKVCILLLSSNINGTKIDMISTVRKFSITHASLIFMYMYIQSWHLAWLLEYYNTLFLTSSGAEQVGG